MKLKSILVAALSCSQLAAYSQGTPITAKDFALVTGSWHGSLTYLDYSSNKAYTMPANLQASPAGKQVFILSNSYPNEPSANSVDTITISDDGKMLNGEAIRYSRTIAGGKKEIVTMYESIDGNDNQQATIRHTYTLGRKLFVKRKDVQFAGTKAWIMRHEFRYNRK